jgi:hypothetical protein
LVVVGAIVVIVPLIASFMLSVISFLVAVLDLATGISIANDVAQVSIILASTMLHWRCYVAPMTSRSL